MTPTYCPEPFTTGFGAGPDADPVAATLPADFAAWLFPPHAPMAAGNGMRRIASAKPFNRPRNRPRMIKPLLPCSRSDAYGDAGNGDGCPFPGGVATTPERHCKNSPLT